MSHSDSQKTNQLYRFGAFQLDAAERRVWREDELIQLAPKQFDLLFYFVENAGRITTKSELLEAVWADTFIEETTLARNVSWLRKMLENGGGESFIETVPKFGYRFTAEVTRLADENTLVVEEEIVQYTRGEEIITFSDAELTKYQETYRETNSVKSFAVYALPILLVIFSLSVGGFYLYRGNAEIAAPNVKAKTNIEKVRIDTAREAFDSGIRIQRGDSITFSIAGEYRYGESQSWTFEGEKNAAAVSNNYFFDKAAPWSLVGWIGTETDRSRYFQVSKISSLTADRNGTLYFAVNKPQNDYTRNRGTLAADVTLKRYAANERPNIKIGSVINLQNRYPNVGGYLDAWGDVWSKPEFAKITTETMFVSTHYNPNRDNGSGSWEIISADGKNDGEPLVVGDRIHLRNKYPDAGYLDACGWIEHLPVFKEFKDQTGAVFTTKSPNRDYGTGTWIVASAAESNGTPVLEGDSIALENGFIVVIEGKVYKPGFLNVAGNVKDIPAYSEHDGASLVFVQNRADDQPVPDIWVITSRENALK